MIPQARAQPNCSNINPAVQGRRPPSIGLIQGCSPRCASECARRAWARSCATSAICRSHSIQDLRLLSFVLEALPLARCQLPQCLRRRNHDQAPGGKSLLRGRLPVQVLLAVGLRAVASPSVEQGERASLERMPKRNLSLGRHGGPSQPATPMRGGVATSRLGCVRMLEEDDARAILQVVHNIMVGPRRQGRDPAGKRGGRGRLAPRWAHCSRDPSDRI